MNDEDYNSALRNALVEIKNSYNDLNWSLILTQDGTLISSEDSAAEQNMSKIADSFQALAEKARAIGGLTNMLINGDNGKIYASSLSDMYIISGLSKNADLVYYRTITNAVFPTIVKILDNLTSSDLTSTPFKPTPSVSYSPPPKPVPVTPVSPVSPITPTISELKIENEDEEETQTEELKTPPIDEELREEPQTPDEDKNERIEAPSQAETVPSQQLIVDRFSGLMVKSDQVQVDADVLKRWSALTNGTEISEVEVESFSGKSLRCRVKVISDSKLEGRGLIRIPEKACQSLEVRRGELVRVQPVIPQADEEEESD
jgi:predicted regulator of Ras-like GTPase activity (Roadblock/LC7/MglB family)